MEPNDSPEPLVDATAVGRFLRVARSTVYDQAAKGLLPHVRLWTGARRPLIRFRMSEIERFVSDRTVGPQTPTE
jgi:predicted DNA-binding transcriptional regulator AlpA